MKGDAKVIEYLNSGLRSELTAVSQFWLHYRLSFLHNTLSEVNFPAPGGCT